MISFLTSILLLFSTVHPGEENLFNLSHLVAIGSITEIKKINAQELSISIKIEKALKGDDKISSLTFTYPVKIDKGHRFKECVDVQTCRTFSRDQRKFYLFNRDLDERYRKLGLKGWQLTDSWFGMTSP